MIEVKSNVLLLVLGQSDDPNCAKCDSRAVCIRFSNATTGVSCVCLPGFALSSSTGRCVLQGKHFSSYVIVHSVMRCGRVKRKANIRSDEGQFSLSEVFIGTVPFSSLPFAEIPQNGICDSRYECFNGGEWR